MSGENKRTILLVEDEVIIAMTETMTLEKFGYNVITANSGEEAVATFEKTPGIDLILIDINLGTGIDGTEAAAIILRQRDLPVVFLSSHTEPEVVAKTEKITSYGYVVKDSSGIVLDASIKMAFKLFEAKIKEKEKESQMEAALAALRESEARLAEAQAVAKVGSWETDLSNLNVIWSEETYRIFEIDPGSFHLTQASFLVFTHPEDCAKVDAAFLGSLDTHSLNAIEHRIVTPGGLVKFIEERWRIFQDDQGRPVRAVGTCQDITERKQAEEAIFQSKKDWEDCFDSITDMITIHDNDYNIVRANKAGKALLKLPALEKHLQTKCFSFYHGADAPPAGCPSCDCLKSGIPGVFELFEPYLNRYLEIRAIPRFDSHNQRAGLIHIVRDITERKREESKREAALEALQESEQRLNFHVNNSPLATIEWTTDFIVTRWSVEAEKIFGWNQSETIGKPMMDLQMIYNEDIPLVQKTMERLSDGSSKRVISTNRNYTKEGKVIICEWYNSVLLNPQGKMISVMSQGMDITERSRVEEELKKSEHLLKEAQKVAHIGYWELDPKIGKPTWSDEIFCIFGLDPKEDEPSFIDHETHLHPDDWPILNTAVTKASTDGTPFDIQLRIIQPGGEIKWMYALGTTIRDSNGVVSKLFGTAQDITERRQVESQREAALVALHESETRSQALLRAIPDMLFRVNRQGVFLDYKADVKDLYAQSETTLIGRRLRDIVPAAFADLIDLKTRATLETGALQNFEYQLPVPGRGERDYEARMVASGADEVTAIIRDITERKRVELELMEAKALVDAVVESVPLMIFLKEATDLRFVIFNRAGEELLGYDRMALLGKNNLDLFPPEQAAHFMAKDREVLDGEAGMLDIPEEPILTAKKGTRLLHTRKVCIRGADGKTKYLLGISEDITERKQAEAEIQRQLAGKGILLKEVHHRIKNNIASIGGLLSLHMQSATNPEAIAVLQEAIGRVNSMRILYDKLLLSEDYKDISVKNYVESLIDSVVSLFPDMAKVALEKQIADFQLDSKRLFPLGIIINELLTNIMKYAFVNRDAGLVKISLTNVDNRVTLTIQDNGIGLPAGFDINEPEGFGLMLVKMLSQQLGGSFSIEKQAGTRCKIEFNI